MLYIEETISYTMSRNHNPEIQVTFREKRALITLASTLVVYGAYFVLFGRAWLGGERASFGFVAPMAAAIAILIVLQIVSFAVAAAAAPSESRAPYDERDRLIDLQACAPASTRCRRACSWPSRACFWGWRRPSSPTACWR
jgi:hypothetical protein